MGLKEKNEIDAIGIDKQTGHVYLTILDGELWEDGDTHVQLLENKIKTYVTFIETGQVYRDYPEAKGRDLFINIIARYELPDIGHTFLEEQKLIVLKAGIILSFQLFKM